MGSYGDVVLLAHKLYVSGSVPSVRFAWERAAATIFPHSDSMQRKGCPMGTFLGLCEEGLVKGIPRGDYTRSSKNKGYALQAVRILSREPDRSFNPDMLWRIIAEDKAPNQQMEVVLALWNHGLINPR